MRWLFVHNNFIMKEYRISIFIYVEVYRNIHLEQQLIIIFVICSFRKITLRPQ